MVKVGENILEFKVIEKISILPIRRKRGPFVDGESYWDEMGWDEYMLIDVFRLKYDRAANSAFRRVIATDGTIDMDAWNDLRHNQVIPFYNPGAETQGQGKPIDPSPLSNVMPVPGGENISPDLDSLVEQIYRNIEGKTGLGHNAQGLNPEVLKSQASTATLQQAQHLSLTLIEDDARTFACDLIPVFTEIYNIDQEVSDDERMVKLHQEDTLVQAKLLGYNRRLHANLTHGTSIFAREKQLGNIVNIAMMATQASPGTPPRFDFR